MRELGLAILMFLLGFLVNHFYRRWYIERPRLKMVLDEANWAWFSVNDDQEYKCDFLKLRVCFTVHNPGAPVSIIQFTISLPQIDGVEIDKRCWGPQPSKQMPADPQHQVTLSCEWTFMKDKMSFLPTTSPGRLTIKDSLGNEYLHKFQVEAPPRSK